MHRTLYMLSGRFSGSLFMLTVAVFVGLYIYTQKLVQELRRDAREVVEFYAETHQRVANSPDDQELSWVFDNVIRQTNFPLIITDESGEPNSWKGISVSENDKSPAAKTRVKRIMKSIKSENEPRQLQWRDAKTGKVFKMGYLYYGDSKLIIQLRSLPYVEIAALGLLIFIAVLGFTSIKRSEQRFIWVGMAKETAHQLGTPISSLMGWLEVIRAEKNLEQVKRTINDMETDVKRLEKIAARFSQIGSEADLKEQDLKKPLHDVVKYFHRRLPQSGKEVRIVEEYGPIPKVPLNRDLFEWVVENLVKNALDAIKNPPGIITISTGVIAENNRVFIDVKDNGCGIGIKNRSDIFKPGYSTKKRGWGLGLNLAKRIVEEYHGGKLMLKETRSGGGTTMRILLRG